MPGEHYRVSTGVWSVCMIRGLHEYHRSDPHKHVRVHACVLLKGKRSDSFFPLHCRSIVRTIRLSFVQATPGGSFSNQSGR